MTVLASVWIQYTILTKNRKKMQKKLTEVDMLIAIHYPVPLHQQDYFKYLDSKKFDFPVAENTCKKVLVIPLNPFLKEETIEFIAQNIKTYLDDHL